MGTKPQLAHPSFLKKCVEGFYVFSNRPFGDWELGRKLRKRT